MRHLVKIRESGEITEKLIDELMKLVMLALRVAKERCNDVPLERDAGLFILVRCLRGDVTKTDWISAFDVAKQRARKRQNAHTSDPQLLLCRLFVYIDVVRSVCEGNRWISASELANRIKRVGCSDVNHHACQTFFGDDDELRAQYWESTILWLILGITAEDLSRESVKCPVCYSPIAQESFVVPGSGLKPGFTLACGHPVCRCCWDRNTACPVCRSDNTKPPEVQYAIVGGFRALRI